MRIGSDLSACPYVARRYTDAVVVSSILVTNKTLALAVFKTKQNKTKRDVKNMLPFMIS